MYVRTGRMEGLIIRRAISTYVRSDLPEYLIFVKLLFVSKAEVIIMSIVKNESI